MYVRRLIMASILFGLNVLFTGCGEDAEELQTSVSIPISLSPTMPQGTYTVEITISGPDMTTRIIRQTLDIQTGSNQTYSITVDNIPVGNNRNVKVEISRDGRVWFVGSKTVNLSSGAGNYLSIDVRPYENGNIKEEVDAETLFGLVFLMTFDEGSGETVNDLSGFNNHGTVGGSADWIDGKFNGAFHFDGSTHIEVPNAEPLSSLTHPMSVGVWVNPDIVGGWRSILEMDGAAGWKIGLHDGSDAIVWTTYYVKDFVAVTPVPVNEWTHIAATWDGSEALMYFNGELDAAVAGGGVIDVSAEPSLDIGWRRSTTSSTFEGGMDELFITTRVLEANEIKGIMDGLADRAAVEPGAKLTTEWGALKNAR